MARSIKLRQLFRRVDFLEQQLLPAERIDGNYTTVERDRIRSYLLLVHAEIESHIEELAKTKVTSSLSKFGSTGRLNHCLASILAFSGNEVSYLNQPNVNTQKISFRVNKSVNHYLSQVDLNHGIKSKNVVELFLPLGIKHSDLDPVWLSTMDSFGSLRGNVAHSSIQIQNLIDRNTVKNIVNNQILPEIEAIEELVKKI